MSDIMSRVCDFLSSCRFVDAATHDYIRELAKKGLVPESIGFHVFRSSNLSEYEIYETGLDFLKNELMKDSRFDPEVIAKVIAEVRGQVYVQQDDRLSRFIIQESPYRKQAEIVKSGDVVVKKYQKIGLRERALFEFLRNESSGSVLWNLRPWPVTLFLSGAILCLGYFFLKFFFEEVFSDHRKFTVLIAICIVSLIGVKFIEVLFASGSLNLVRNIPYPIILPFSAILIGIFLGIPLSAFVCSCLVLIYTLGADIWNNTIFNSINILSVGFSFLMIRKIHRSNSIFKVCVKLWFPTLAATTVIRIFDCEWNIGIFVWDALFNFIFSFVTAIFVIGLVPLLDVFFGSSSKHALLLLLDPEQEYLKRLFTEALGTYQHSVLVGCMAEAAANAIQRDGLLCRVAGQYHDIGKLVNPSFFVENRSSGIAEDPECRNIVKDLEIILSHVSEGINLASKIHLPETVIKVIKEHHGTTMVHSLYYDYKNSKPKENERILDENFFRYKGKKPSTIESTIIMLADSFEAASRSLGTVTEKSLSELLDKIVAQKFSDGQFEYSPLTLAELKLCKQAMLKTLFGALHLRRKYPEALPEQNILLIGKDAQPKVLDH